MAKYRVQSVQERPDAEVACDTFVLNDSDAEIGHFTVLISAAEVLAAAGLPEADRVSLYKTLFAADPRIQGVADSEAAVSQIEADLSFPITVNL